MNKVQLKQTEIGKVPPGWTETMLGAVAEPVSKTHAFLKKEEIIFINTGDILAGKFLHRNYSRVSTLPGQAKKMIARNNILFSEIRPINKRYAFVDFDDTADYVVSTKLMVIKAKENILPEFLYRVLISNDALIEFQHIAESRSGTFPQITFDAIRHYPMLLPAFKEQRAISKILSDLDGKIELNHQMNKTLEAMGQALFKRWFVDFDFPDKNGKPYKLSGGKMVDSELGEIPEGWTVKEVSDCGEVVCGKTPPTADKDNYGDDIFFITIPDMRGQVFVIKTERKLSKKGTLTQTKKELPSLSICVSCIATPGLVSLTSTLSHTNQQINSIVCNKGISPYFMYYTMLDKSEEIKSMGLGGTATLNLNTGNFARIKIAIPEKATMDAFHKIITPSMEKILYNSIEIDGLCNIRDSLLPRLMSGKIRV